MLGSEMEHGMARGDTSERLDCSEQVLAGTEQQPSLCVGEPRESEECGQTTCPSWGPWTDWTSCTVRQYQTSPQLDST